MNIRGVAWPALLFCAALGCDGWGRFKPEPDPPCIPYETGLTLVYEPVDLPEAERLTQRAQIRVDSTRETPEGLVVELTNTSLRGVTRTVIRVARDGGAITLLNEGRPVVNLLPPGFPDFVEPWYLGKSQYRVLGRAQVHLDIPGLEDLVGTWVEGRMSDGSLERALYVPGIGEAEMQVWEGGSWKPRRRLVSRGFTDAPPAPRGMMN